MIETKSAQEIEIMRKSSKIVALLLDLLKQHIRPGITTMELDEIAEDYIHKQNAKPAFKGYRGYPATICASVNEEIVHGIPGKRKLLNGDIISVDVGVLLDGFYGDAARTYAVGDISKEAKRLMRITEECLYKGIKKARVGGRLSDISNAIQVHAEKAGFSVVRDFVGHGIGRNMHEEPQIPNFGPPLRGVELREGMTIAIEPMINIGSYEVELLEDGWTAITKDKSLSAHFEHTIAITKDGQEILSKI